MAIAGLDFGQRRIGVAIAHNDTANALPIGAIRRISLKQDLAAIRTLLASREVRCVVVGLPLNMDGSEGRQARIVRTFAQQLANDIAVPVEFYDERLTSFEAEDRLKEASGGGSRKNKEAVDAVAAAIILDGWLRERRSR